MKTDEFINTLTSDLRPQRSLHWVLLCGLLCGALLAALAFAVFLGFRSDILSALTSIFEGVFGIRWTKDALTVHVNSPWPWAKLSNLRIRKSLLDLELTADGSLVAKINGKEVATSADRKVELPWEMFT